MKKNILTALVLSSAVFVFSTASAQETTGKKNTTETTTMQKGATPVAPGSTTTKEQKPTNTSKQTVTDNQNNLTPKEVAAKVTEWMKTNIGTDDAQSGRINVAASNLLTKVREIRKNVTDPEIRKAQIHEAMQTYEAQIKSVLKPEQYEIYKTKKPELVKDFKEMKNETVNE